MVGRVLAMKYHNEFIVPESKGTLRFGMTNLFKGQQHDFVATTNMKDLFGHEKLRHKIHEIEC